MEKAISTLNIDVTVIWEPFFLNKNIPKEGVPLRQYLEEKFGAAVVARMEQPNNPLTVAGNIVGIQFNSSRKIVRTMDAHRLLEWCKLKHPDCVDLLVETIFHKYFINGEDISQPTVLEDIAWKVGLVRDEVREMLSSSAYIEMVLEKNQYCTHTLNVSSVPYFVIQPSDGHLRPIVFSGAQVSSRVIIAISKTFFFIIFFISFDLF